MPTIPSVFSNSSVRFSSFLSHFPSFMLWCASTSRLGTASMRAMASSATATDDAFGVFMTSIPRALHASRSTLSRPTPPRMISFSFGAPSRNSFVALVLDRMSRTSASASLAMSVTTSPKGASRPGSFSSNASAIRIFIAHPPGR